MKKLFVLLVVLVCSVITPAFCQSPDQVVFSGEIVNEDSKPVLRFFSTPYGLVGIGNNSVGLIEMDKAETDSILLNTEKDSVNKTND